MMLELDETTVIKRKQSRRVPHLIPRTGIKVASTGVLHVFTAVIRTAIQLSERKTVCHKAADTRQMCFSSEVVLIQLTGISQPYCAACSYSCDEDFDMLTATKLTPCGHSGLTSALASPQRLSHEYASCVGKWYSEHLLRRRPSNIHQKKACYSRRWWLFNDGMLCKSGWAVRVQEAQRPSAKDDVHKQLVCVLLLFLLLYKLYW